MIKLIRALFLLGLLLVGGVARADYPPTVLWYFGPQNAQTAIKNADPQIACDTWMKTMSSSGYCRLTSVNGGYKASTYDASGFWSTVDGTPVNTCPQGGTLGSKNSVLICIKADEDPCAGNDVKNPFIRSFSYASQNSGVLPVDDGTCKITNVTLLNCYTTAAGAKYCYFKFNKTTAKKDATAPALPSPAAADVPAPTPAQPTDKPSTSPALPADLQGNCPAGTVQAGVDPSGIPKCIGTGTAPQNPTPAPTSTTKPPTTTSNSDGSSVTKQDVVQTNSDGSQTTTTTTTTTAADGTKTVSVSVATSGTPSGGMGRQDVPDTDQQSFCKQNPTLTMCINSTVSGTCSEISCTGDAIQCSTLRAAAQLQCQQKKNEDDLKASGAYSLGSSVLAGADPASSTLPSPSKADVVTVANPDSSGWLGGGSYFKDKAIPMPDGQTLVLPLSKAGDIMIALRYVTMIVCSLVCFKIVRGSFTATGV